MNKAHNLIILFILSLFLLTSCATAPVTAKRDEPGDIEALRREHTVRSLAVFSQILALKTSSGESEALLSEKEKLYEKIIREYHEAPLAQESYYRLINIYLNDYSSPDFKKAEALYSAFQEKYPGSIFTLSISKTIAKSYYVNEEWERLLNISASSYNEYLQSGKRPSSLLIFMYAEANYKLGRYKEAEEGYNAVLKLFPDLSSIDKVNKRLKEIGKDKR